MTDLGLLSEERTFGRALGGRLTKAFEFAPLLLRPRLRLPKLRKHVLQLQDLEFAEWRRGVGPEEINVIVPEVVRHIPRACESSLRVHFDENVWPARRAAIPELVDAERAEISRQIDQALMEVKN